MSVIIPADAADAFSHLFMVGLASILEDADAERVCAFRWKDTLQAFEMKTNDDLDIGQIAEVVHAHAKRWSQSLPLTSEDDYTVADENAKPSKTLHATMSPRLSNLGIPLGWEKLQKGREAAVDAMQTAGDYRYFGALGQPSYWSGKKNKDELQSDYGASRWEMVTRNQGKEFVRDRLLPLSRIVTTRSVNEICDGLLGVKVEDEAGKNKPTSRTATGLHAPSKTDNARAWCALIGVSAFPTRVSTAGSGTSAGANVFRDSSAALFQLKGQIRFAVLPLFDQYWTTAKYRSVVRSSALAEFGIQNARPADAQSRLASASTDWLEEKGVLACCLFNQFMSDNASAPERWLEPGTIIPIKEAED
ncbi:hypothetical protein [Bifidobacterium ruminantium]|uniref:hypothetical protein n=1 Tax=Bifidobacterium ruminantium TaxID=78346 RepID=UPI0024920B93|nr:hypothetical protein [Bifidobacterium ruminantium]